MQREFRNSSNLGSIDISYKCGFKIYGLTMAFILMTIISWLFTILLELNTLLIGDLFHICTSIVMLSILITFTAMDLARKRLHPRWEWFLTFLLIGTVTIWSLRIINGTTFLEFILLLVYMIILMVVLTAIGSKCSMDSIVIYASFMLIWWFMSLGLMIVLLFVVYALESYSWGVYLFAVIIYPYFISSIIYTGMIVNSGRFHCDALIKAVAPARNVYLHFVMIYLVSLLVLRVFQKQEVM
ncbi:uncharacterized protein LOC142240333 [Haematobia irritans]|uniref:uncharacterized protein LOC142240333 n=1 Tax=Haematobia irritans TaxID=7368 RepID=UPI003F4F5DB2